MADLSGRNPCPSAATLAACPVRGPQAALAELDEVGPAAAKAGESRAASAARNGRLLSSEPATKAIPRSVFR